MFKPGSPRVSGCLAWKDCVFGKSWQCSPHGKQWRRLSAKPKEAAALQILLHRRPACPSLPRGQRRLGASPAWSLPGAGPFHLQLAFPFPGSSWHQWYFGPSCQGCLEFAGLGLPFCTVPKLEVSEKRERRGETGGSGGLLRLTSCIHHLLAWEPLCAPVSPV